MREAVVVKYESWTERLVREAMERGEFDNLPGAGKPIPGINGREDPNWWIKNFLDREQLPMPLPTSLALRKEIQELPETLADVSDEATVREIVRDLNYRIVKSYRHADGPQLDVRPVNAQKVVAEWRQSNLR